MAGEWKSSAKGKRGMSDTDSDWEDEAHNRPARREGETEELFERRSAREKLVWRMRKGGALPLQEHTTGVGGARAAAAAAPASEDSFDVPSSSEAAAAPASEDEFDALPRHARRPRAQFVKELRRRQTLAFRRWGARKTKSDSV